VKFRMERKKFTEGFLGLEGETNPE
jgi:hypothetical protein